MVVPAIALHSSPPATVPQRTLLLTLLCLDGLVALVCSPGLMVRGEPFSLFDLDAQANFPAWYSSTKFALAGILMGLLTVAVRFRYVTPLLLAAFFLAFSADEAASMQERIGHRLADQVVPGLSMVSKDAFLWPLLFGIPAAAAIGVMFWRLAKERYFSIRTWQCYTTALAVMFAESVGFEISRST